MNDVLKTLLANQYEASLCTLACCVTRCPGSEWHVPVARYPFSQVVFHTLFFTDYYLSQTPESIRSQPFHIENRELFSDYEQLQQREPTSIYDRDHIELYSRFCREKASRVMESETEESLAASSQFPRRTFSRGELHVYNVRHIEHHAAQLALKLRINRGIEIPWIGSGWIDT